MSRKFLWDPFLWQHALLWEHTPLWEHAMRAMPPRRIAGMARSYRTRKFLSDPSPPVGARHAWDAPAPHRGRGPLLQGPEKPVGARHACDSPAPHRGHGPLLQGPETYGVDRFDFRASRRM